MPGPTSVPVHLSDPQGSRFPHDRCQDRERCTGPGCRRRTGKTAVAKGGAVRQAVTDELARFRAARGLVA